MATEMFGEMAPLVIRHVDAIESIHEQSRSEVASKRSEWEKDRDSRIATMEAESKTFGSVQESVTNALIEKYPQFFAVDEKDAASAKAMKEGMEVVQGAVKSAKNLPVNERAAKAAIISMWAAAFPRLSQTVTSLRSELDKVTKDYETKLAKLRGGDPGNADGGGSSGGGGDEPKNTAAMAAKYRG